MLLYLLQILANEEIQKATQRQLPMRSLKLSMEPAQQMPVQQFANKSFLSGISIGDSVRITTRKYIHFIFPQLLSFAASIHRSGTTDGEPLRSFSLVSAI